MSEIFLLAEIGLVITVVIAIFLGTIVLFHLKNQLGIVDTKVNNHSYILTQTTDLLKEKFSNVHASMAPTQVNASLNAASLVAASLNAASLDAPPPTALANEPKWIEFADIDTEIYFVDDGDNADDDDLCIDAAEGEEDEEDKVPRFEELKSPVFQYNPAVRNVYPVDVLDELSLSASKDGDIELEIFNRDPDRVDRVDRELSESADSADSASTSGTKDSSVVFFELDVEGDQPETAVNIIDNKDIVNAEVEEGDTVTVDEVAEENSMNSEAKDVVTDLEPAVAESVNEETSVDNRVDGKGGVIVDKDKEKDEDEDDISVCSITYTHISDKYKNLPIAILRNMAKTKLPSMDFSKTKKKIIAQQLSKYDFENEAAAPEESMPAISAVDPTVQEADILDI